MKKAYIVIGVIYYAILGCSAAKKPAPGAVGLTSQELNTVRAINRLHGMALDVARQSTTLADTPDEKASKLTKMIQDGKCAQTFQKPGDQYDVSWQAAWQVSSATCPINVNEATDYKYEKVVDRKGTKVSGTLSFQRTFNMQPDFQSELGVSPLSVHGSLHRGQKANGTFEVSGNYVYDQFLVDQIGRVNAEISVVPHVDGGSILLKLSINGSPAPGSSSNADIVANLEIDWDKNGRTYSLNGGPGMTRAAFLDLFSSFELLELLDRIQKMM